MVLIIKIGMMKKSWLLYFMGLIALCGCSRMITKESEEGNLFSSGYSQDARSRDRVEGGT